MSSSPLADDTLPMRTLSLVVVVGTRRRVGEGERERGRHTVECRRKWSFAVVLFFTFCFVVYFPQGTERKSVSTVALGRGLARH